MMGFTTVSNVIKFYIKVLKTRPQDALANAFIWIVSILVYYYGTFVLLPVVLEGCSSIVQIVMGLIIPHYLFFAVISNLVLLNRRNSSIRNKILIRPPVKLPPRTNTNHEVFNGAIGGEGDQQCQSQGQDSEHELKERTKFMSEQFTATPFEDELAWHICAACEVFVPARTWHCGSCNTCILRRDHHCIFTMCCVGEENHCNFIGLLFYLGCGTTIASTVSFIYHVYFKNILWYMFIVKCFVPFYTILFDADLLNMLSGITAVGQITAWGVFGFYMYLAFQGRTSADHSRTVYRVNKRTGKKFGFDNLRNLLGPNPIFRILWPYHQVIVTSITAHEDCEPDDRKGFSWNNPGNLNAVHEL